MCLFRWQSYRRNYIPILTRRRPQHLVFALHACLAGGPGGGTTSQYRHTVDCNHSTSYVVLVSWAVLVEDLQSKRLPLLRGIAFLCRSIIQTPPFPVASRSDHRTPYSRDPPHLLFYSSPSAALTMGFPPLLLS